MTVLHVADWLPLRVSLSGLVHATDASATVASDRHVERALVVAVLVLLAAFVAWWLAQ